MVSHLPDRDWSALSAFRPILVRSAPRPIGAFWLHWLPDAHRSLFMCCFELQAALSIR
jgi:hypothetical protein